MGGDGREAKRLEKVMARDPVCGGEVKERKAPVAAFYRGKVYYFCSAECRETFWGDPEAYAPLVHSMALKVGVMGAASGLLPAEVRSAAYDLGAAIAEREMVVVTGAAPGLPWESARGAKERGGLSVGVSPALSLDEHQYVYESPADFFDVMVYTGSGLMGREIVNIRSSDIVVIVGGHSGTLGEFAIAYDEGKLIGVLEGSGGIADAIPALLEAIAKETGARVVYDSDPESLIARLVEEYVTAHYREPSVFENQEMEEGRPRMPKG
jgi:uncharacterized protein (TIGR00725 family)